MHVLEDTHILDLKLKDLATVTRQGIGAVSLPTPPNIYRYKPLLKGTLMLHCYFGKASPYLTLFKPSSNISVLADNQNGTSALNSFLKTPFQ
jgi:hypothetical protein